MSRRVPNPIAGRATTRSLDAILAAGISNLHIGMNNNDGDDNEYKDLFDEYFGELPEEPVPANGKQKVSLEREPPERVSPTTVYELENAERRDTNRKGLKKVKNVVDEYMSLKPTADRQTTVLDLQETARQKQSAAVGEAQKKLEEKKADIRLLVRNLISGNKDFDLVAAKTALEAKILLAAEQNIYIHTEIQQIIRVFFMFNPFGTKAAFLSRQKELGLTFTEKELYEKMKRHHKWEVSFAEIKAILSNMRRHTGDMLMWQDPEAKTYAFNAMRHLIDTYTIVRWPFNDVVDTLHEEASA